FRGLRKFFIELKYSNRRIDSRQGAKHAKFGGERRIIWEKFFTVILRPLRPCRLCARYSEFWLRLCRARSSTFPHCEDRLVRILIADGIIRFTAHSDLITDSSPCRGKPKRKIYPVSIYDPVNSARSHNNRSSVD